MKKLDIKDNNNNNVPQNQNQVKGKPAEKTGGLKDLLNTNTNSNNNRERPRTTRGGRK